LPRHRVAKARVASLFTAERKRVENVAQFLDFWIEVIKQAASKVEIECEDQLVLRPRRVTPTCFGLRRSQTFGKRTTVRREMPAASV